MTFDQLYKTMTFPNLRSRQLETGHNATLLAANQAPWSSASIDAERVNQAVSTERPIHEPDFSDQPD